jgi:outer membrane protein assembly factor BamB
MKNVTAQINNGHEDCVVKIPGVETKYNAKYVGQMALRTVGGGWSEDIPGEVFYQANPPHGYSNYMALIIQRGTLYITSGASAVEGVISGVIADDGEIIYSRARHDMRYSTDKTVWIDGGRDYMRSGTHGRFVVLKVVDGEWFELDATEIAALGEEAA